MYTPSPSFCSLFHVNQLRRFNLTAKCGFLEVQSFLQAGFFKIAVIDKYWVASELNWKTIV